jgi:uncharacterized protein YdiU (UPF0061 family)
MPTFDLDPIQAFVGQLYSAAGLDKLPSDLKSEYGERIGVEVNRRIGLSMMEALNEQSLEEFNKLMEKEEVDPAEAMAFFQQNVPDFEARMQKVFADFTKEFVSAADQLKGLSA